MLPAANVKLVSVPVGRQCLCTVPLGVKKTMSHLAAVGVAACASPLSSRTRGDASRVAPIPAVNCLRPNRLIAPTPIPSLRGCCSWVFRPGPTSIPLPEVGPDEAARTPN